MNFKPVIKWSGSKRSQSEEIIKSFPKTINTYYEPFVGGGSVLRQLLHSDIKVNKYICSDINKDLISLWNMIKNNPSELIKKYTSMWNELNIDNDIERKKQYYYKIRNSFNKLHTPEDFLFLSRTAINGLIRYNSKGEFNSSFHLTRNGIIPKTLESILLEWSNLLNVNNVLFVHNDYINIETNIDDFMYLDPPYAGTKGMYNGVIDFNVLWNWLDEQPCKYALSFDGTCGVEDRTFNVPESVYNEHLYLYSGTSNFKKLKEIGTEYVKESLYLKR